MKSVVVDSNEYEWKFSLFSFSVSWKQQCCSQTAKSMLTHQLESCCSTAWPSWYREDVFMQSPGKEVNHTYKSSLHTWRAYWDKQSQFIFKMFLGGMYCTVLLKCACNAVMQTAPVFCIYKVTPPPFLRFVTFRILSSHSGKESTGYMSVIQNSITQHLPMSGTI